jgi:hypothetical protein
MVMLMRNEVELAVFEALKRWIVVCGWSLASRRQTCLTTQSIKVRQREVAKLPNETICYVKIMPPSITMVCPVM